MIQALQIEILRLRFCIKLWILLLVLAAVCVLCSTQGYQGSGSTVFDLSILMSCQRYTALLGAPLSAYVYGLDFQWRSFYGAIYHGISRTSIFVAKLIIFLLLGSLLSTLAALGTVLYTGTYIPPQTATLLVRRILWDFRIWGAHLLFANLMKRPAPIVVAGTAYGFWCLLRPTIDISVWTSNIVHPEFLLSIGIFALCSVLALILFLHAELK